MSEWAQYYASEITASSMLGNLNAHGPLFDAILAESPRHVLEVGVGTGVMGVFLGLWGVSVSGLDNDAKVLERAADTTRRFGQKVEFIQGDAFDLQAGIGEREFDVVYSQGFFEHFDDDQIRALVTQQLNAAPTVIFSVPGNGYPTRDFGNERLMSPIRWARILEGTGELDVRPYGLAGMNPVSVLRRTVLRQALHVLVTVRRKQA